MKKNILTFALSVITLLLFAADTVTAQNQFNFNTQYPVWHYFDNALGDLGSAILVLLHILFQEQVCQLIRGLYYVTVA